MSAPRLVVIVGGGVAALRAAERLVERGFRGRIEIVADEHHAPYRRPALSDALVRAPSAATLRLRARLGDQVSWHHGRRAVGLDPVNRRVLLDDGRYGPYEGLIIATGTVPRRLAVSPPAERSLALRTVEDAVRVHDVSRRARRLLIIGGGLVGTEVAALLRARGVRVTIVDNQPQLLSIALGTRVGVAMTALHRRHGVDIRQPTDVRVWEADAAGVTGHLQDGELLRADAALVAIGAVPATEWLASSGLDTANGILCGPTLHALGAEDVVAAGDCARWPNLRHDTVARRFEQWTLAAEMGRHAADALMDGRERAAAFTPVQWGWTTQWGQRVTVIGRPLDGELTAIGDPDRLRGALVGRDEQGRLTGALVCNDTPLAVRIHRAMSAGAPSVTDRMQRRFSRTRRVAPTVAGGQRRPDAASHR